MKTDSTAARPLITILSEEIRTKLAYMIINNEITARDVSDTFDLDASTPHHWVHEINKKLENCIGTPSLTTSSVGGNSEIIDTISKENFIAKAASFQMKNKSIYYSNAKTEFINEINETRVFLFINLIYPLYIFFDDKLFIYFVLETSWITTYRNVY